MANKATQDARVEAAQIEFENYDFDAYEHPDNERGGFEWASNEDSVSCNIFIQDPDGESADSLLGSFVVEFEADSANVVSAYATLGGEDIGRRPAEGLQPSTI